MAFSLILYPHRHRRSCDLLTLWERYGLTLFHLDDLVGRVLISTPAALFAHDGGAKSLRTRCNKGRLASSAFWIAHDAFESLHMLTTPTKP